MKSLALLLSGMTLLASAHGSPLATATITHATGEVRSQHSRSGERPLGAGDRLREAEALHTGKRSRCELRLPDGALARLGAGSALHSRGPRDLELRQGTILLHVPTGAGTLRLRTASGTAVLSDSTILVENAPGEGVKVIALAGRPGFVPGDSGRTLALHGGQMLVIRSGEVSVPRPFTIDLRRNLASSLLTGAGPFGPLPADAAKALSAAIACQQSEISQGRLAPSDTDHPPGRSPAEESQRRLLDLDRGGRP